MQPLEGIITRLLIYLIIQYFDGYYLFDEHRRAFGDRFRHYSMIKGNISYIILTTYLLAMLIAHAISWYEYVAKF